MWWLSLAAVAAEPEQAAAAPAELVGRVREYGSGVPLEGVVVNVAGQTLTTDARGRFQLRLPAGVYPLTLVSSDHSGSTSEETLESGERLKVEYRLRRFSWDEEVVVYGEHREEVSRQVISMDELRRVPGSFGDPVRALQSLPGVSRPSTVEGDIVVRGAEGLNTGTFVDGVRVPFMFHFLAGRSVVSPDLIQDVEFFPGGMPSRFGDVTQGVVNLRTDFRPAKKGLHGKVHADLLDAGASLSANLADGWTVHAGGRISWISGVISVAQDINLLARGELNAATRPRRIQLPYNDWQLRVVKRSGPDVFSVTALGALDGVKLTPARRDQDGDGEPDPYVPDPNRPTDINHPIENRFVRLTFRWDHTTPAHDMSTWVSVGNDRQRNLIPGLGVLFSGPTGAQVTTGWFRFRHEQRLTLAPALTTRFGVDARVQPSVVESYLGAQTPEDVKVSTDTRMWGSPFAELQWHPNKLWVAPGFRVSWHRLARQNHVVPEPRLSVRYALNPVWTLSAFAGYFAQSPPTDRYASGLGYPQARVMKSLQGSVGVEGRWPSGVEINANLYWSELEDLIVKQVFWSVERPVDVDGGATAVLSQRPYYTPVRGRAFGVETQVRLRPNGGWFGWVGLTLGRALRIDGDTTYPSKYDTPFSFVLVAAKDLPKGWGISGRLRLSSGQPYTPQAGVRVGDDYFPMSLSRNSARYPFFHRFDIRVDKTWTGKRARWTLYLDVYNALNAQNPIFATYDYDFENFRPQGYIPIIPTLGLQVAY